MHQPVFANIEISRTGAASPLVGQALRNVVLKSVDARKAALLPRLHLVINTAFFVAQRLHLPAAVMNDADGRTESQRNRALANSQRILWITDSASDDRIDIHMKVGMFGQQLQLAVQNFQTLFRNVIGIHVIDGNLQPLQPGAIQTPNAIRNQQIAVGNEPRNHAIGPNAPDHLIKLRMQQRLAAGNRDYRRA